MVRSENPSDSVSRRRPVSESDEISDLTHLVSEISRCEIFTFSIHSYHVSEHHSMGPASSHGAIPGGAQVAHNRARAVLH